MGSFLRFKDCCCMTFTYLLCSHWVIKPLSYMKRVFCLSFILIVTQLLHADVTPASLFQDNMVIQRDARVAVWGKGSPGEIVKVSGSWSQEMAESKVDKNGKWKVRIETPQAGGPHTLTIQGKNRVSLNNILSGDVWLCSGQ